VALHVAAARPHLVAGVALLDGAVLFPEEVRAQILAEVVPLLEGPAWADVLRGFFSSRAFDAHESAELRARILDELGRAPSYLPACVMRDVMASDHADLLAGDWPLLYVHAGIPADLARLRELRPDALIGSVAGGGHWMMLSVPEQVNAMLDTFLDVVAARVSEVAATV
jgi:pimeloyl-ACP methyl ester carboxylesterase